ncbi:MAG: hypothetical protein EZS28_013772 [Streblomastix strix]|uniref:Uncharacterized protein n=1 Tax=Streblomastix strix TaxID=222440 RepID=A0A5J4W7U3_9EUKA|nr:MAG: hypothetical protein EZS28_013772 [Streblomastix strix]
MKNKPVAIKACMHRFCEDCAKTAIQNMKIGVAYIKIPGVLNKTDSTAQKTLNRKNSVNSNSHTHQSPHSQSSHGAQHAVTSPAQLNALKQKRLEALKSMARFFEPEMIEQMEQELKVGQKEETPKMNRQLSQQKISGQTPKNNKGQLNDQYGYDNEYQSEEDRPTSPIDIISDEKDDDCKIASFFQPNKICFTFKF